MRILSALLLLFGGGLAIAAPEFAVERAVVETTEREELGAVVLDRHVYAATRDGFPDLRILLADGTPVPHLVQPQTQRASRWHETTEPARQVESLAPNADGNRLEVILVPPREREAPAWLDLVTPIRDFEKQVSVFIPAAGAAWQALTENQPVYDYSRFMDVRRCRVALPGAPVAARYRVVIADLSDTTASTFVELTTRSGGGQPDQETVRRVLHRRDFRLDQVRFGYRAAEEYDEAPVLAEYPLVISGTERDAEAGVTHLTLATERLPITALRLAIADRNVSRPATVEVRRTFDDGSVQWVGLGQGTLRLLDFHALHDEALTLTLPETRAESLRITLVDRDSPPLTVTGVTAIGPVYRALFLARPGAAHRLAYGSRRAEPPRYQDDALRQISGLKGREVRTLSLTPPDPAASLPPEPPLVRAVNSRWTLFAALGLAVVVLGLAMVAAARRLARLEPPASGPSDPPAA